jgi:hypothetical protein
MARKGDIESKSVASRIQMDTYIKLLKMSSSNKQTISMYVANLIDLFINKGGIPEPKIVEVEKLVSDPKQAIRIKTLEDKLLKAEQEILEKDKKTEEDKLLKEKIIELVQILNDNPHPLAYDIKLLTKKLYPDLNID